MGQQKRPLTGQAGITARQAPRLNKVLKEGQDGWNRAEFEEYLYRDHLEAKNRDIPPLGCIEKKGPLTVCSACNFDCYLECAALTITHRLRGLNQNFKEGLLTQDEAKHIYALMRTTQDEIKIIMKKRGTGFDKDRPVPKELAPRHSGLVDEFGVPLLSVLKESDEEVKQIGADIGVTKEDMEAARAERDKGNLAAKDVAAVEVIATDLKK